MNYKLVIFDFDGTLADSFPYFLETINTLATAYNFPPITPDKIEQARGMEARELIKAARIPAWKLPLMARDFIRLMARDIKQISLFAGVESLLQQLSAGGIKLAIVSSNSEANIRQVLGVANASLIDHYGCGTSLFGKKRKFNLAMRVCGVKREQVLCVGDEIRDAQAARQVAMAFRGVTWGYAPPAVLAAHVDEPLFDLPGDIAQLVLG